MKFPRLIKLALLIYWVVLTFLLLKPAHLQEEAWYIFNGVDKLVHISIFIALGFLFRMVFPRVTFLVFTQVMLLYAFLTEIFQEAMHMGRSMEFLDVVADFIGICIGYYIYKIVNKIFS